MSTVEVEFRIDSLLVIEEQGGKLTQIQECELHSLFCMLLHKMANIA
ncbi:hypothetical protein [Psychrobacillus sp. FSL H8-0510]